MADILLITKIPDQYIAQATAYLLRARPIPQIEDPENEGEMIDEYTVRQWATRLQRDFLFREIREGKRLTEKDLAGTLSDNIVETGE